jgi:UDP-N-acetylglucosamine--N-acetylmuramyl-(pentapeptide) pyrophosphoryl-undecaprenol N-acetylglucosamine transferase
MFLQKGKLLKKLDILVVSAWTGGHIYPGICILEALKECVQELNVTFVTNKKGPAPAIVKKHNYRAVFVEAEASLKQPLLVFKAFNLLRKSPPDVILGLGGFLSAVICVVGKFMGIPVFAHEQNLIPGRANRTLYRLFILDRLFVSFKETKKLLKGDRCFYSGNPVRKEFFRVEKEKKSRFTILVIGGSQGSVTINSIFLQALKLLLNKGINPCVIHQTGEVDFERVKKEYEKIGVSADVFGFSYNMPELLSKADLVISRAGASSIFELAAAGKPSILIPYPFATDNHQEKNALMLERIGGGVVILQSQLTPEKLAMFIEAFVHRPELLHILGHNARKLANPESARMIAEHIVNYMSQMRLKRNETS